MDFLNITNETEIEFQEIATKLFNEYAIITHNSEYRILEMEFYWNSNTHIDKSTYTRTHVEPKSGEWFFHYSGVDIALENKTSGGYGGILLRSIYDLNNKKVYKGPMVCAMRLFSGTNAFSDTIKTKIVPHNFTKTDIQKTERIGLGKNALENGANKLQYRFVIKH
ncbi:hypothetical protein [Ferruginibacter sp.]|nr:hypothetical protein [Ferruginibacter sp.]